MVMGERDRQEQDTTSTGQEEKPETATEAENLANLLGDDYLSKMEIPPWRKWEKLEKDSEE